MDNLQAIKNFCIDAHLAQFQNNITKFFIGIAHLGRSESKLKDVLEAASASTGIEGLDKSIPVVVCDVSDPESLNQMAKSTRLVSAIS